MAKGSIRVKGEAPPNGFTGFGIGLKSGETPVSVRFPAHIKAVLDTICDRQNFVRSAVLEKLEREGIDISNPKS